MYCSCCLISCLWSCNLRREILASTFVAIVLAIVFICGLTGCTSAVNATSTSTGTTSPQAAAYPSTLSWGSVMIGQAGALQTATLSNTGSTSIDITGVAITGANAADFSVSQTNCGSSLAASAACTATVLFQPTAQGARAAELTFSDSATGSPQQISLSGSGEQAPPPPGSASASPSAVTWQQVAVGSNGTPQTVTLTNTGTVAVNFSSIDFTGTDASDFAIDQNTCGSSLAAAAACTTTILFKPTVAGTRTATLTYTDDAGNSPQEVAVSGTGTVTPTGAVTISPTSLSFGTANIGATSAPQMISISNTTPTPVNLAAASISGTNAADFSVSSTTCQSTLAASASCSASVVFLPAAAGSFSALFTVTAGNSSTPLTVSLAGSGINPGPFVTALPSSITWPSVAIGSSGAQQSATLTNSGTSPVTISSIGLTGTNPGDFSISQNTCGSALAASTSCTVTISFTPTATGARSATLAFTDSDSSSPQQISLTGTGESAGSVSASPTSLSFGSVNTGSSSSSQSITITNTTPNSVTLSAASISGTNTADFSVSSSTCASALAASASCTESIIFSPAAAGSRAAIFSITSSASSTPLSIALSGTGNSSGPLVTALPSTITWQSVPVLSSGAQKSATLTNNGSSAISISNIGFNGADPGDFSIYQNTCGSTLASSSSCTVAILFTPTASGTRTATLTFTDTDSTSPQQISLSGIGGGSGTSTTYYVSNCGTVGSDSNNGTSQSTPWLTIAKVNSSTFKPGDYIDFNDGCTWREQLTLPSPGTASSPITIGTYGSGNPPVISGSVVVSSWIAEPQSGTNFTSDPNLQAYWTMAQMSGSSFLDSTANGNALTNVNGVTQSTTSQQSAYSAAFNSSANMLLTRPNANLSANFVGQGGTTNTSITVGGWLYFNTIAPDMSFIMKGSGKSWGLFMGINSNSGKLEWQSYLDSGYHVVFSDRVLTTGRWYHVVGRIDAATDEQALFINGAKQTQTYTATSTTLSTDTTPLDIGGSSNGNYLNGNVDDLFVFNRALSDSEIASIYNAGFDGSLGLYNDYYVTGFSEPDVVYENGVAMKYASQKSGMTPGSWWWDSVNDRVYIRPTGDVDPSTETFELPQRTTCINDYRNYTIVNGITCQEASQRGVYVTGANVTIENMLIQHMRWNGSNAPNNNGYGVGIFWEGSNDIIQNNIVLDANWGIFSYVLGGNTISSGLVQSNTVYNIGYDGIGLAVATPNGGTITNTIAQFNVVHDIGIYNLDGGALECMYGGSTIGTGNAIRYNLVYNNGTPTRHSYALNVQGGAGSCAFYGNIVYNNYGPCFEVAKGPGGNTFVNNVCYNNGLAGETAGFFLVGGATDTGNIVENNIVEAGSSATFMDVASGTGPGNTFDYNLYYGGTSTPFTWNGTAYSLSAYLGTSGQDSHSINANPQFNNPSSNDFTLMPSSPAIGAGFNLGSQYQFELQPGSSWPNAVHTASQSSSGAWDIGAYVSGASSQ